MKPGDLVLIRFPQADLKQGKLRPQRRVILNYNCSAIAQLH